MARRRLDDELVRRGLASTPAQAQDAVRDGLVLLGGMPATKPGTLVADDAPLHLAPPRAIRYASRGGSKLAAALDRFGIDPSGRACLDAGSSTGGFTDCLLERGAASVVAVDVGYGQLDWRLRTNPRVHVRERTNVRDLVSEGFDHPPSLVVVDLSFVSLRTVLRPLVAVASAAATFVMLVKPQFEVASTQVGPGGIVREPDHWHRVVSEVAEAARSLGLGGIGVMASPLRGARGNVEFLLAARRGEPGSTLDIDAAIAEGEALP